MSGVASMGYIAGMRVMGIDPGSTTTGWGVVERDRGRFRLVAAGVVRTRSDDPIPHRLQIIFNGLKVALGAQAPESVAVEAIFRHKSSESALRLGQARGVALLAVAEAGLIVHEYNTMTVKKSVSGSGKADKDQVARAVSMLVGQPLDLPADATDALALAITHLAHAPALMRRPA